MIAVNGTQLYHEVTGTSGTPVVLVHGSWGDHHNWDAVAPALARSFRVLTYDRRGHSRSARPEGPGSLREDAMDLAALLEALGMVPAHVVGNSGGAAVALRLASERPELFRSLTVHEPPLFALLADDPAMRAPLAAVMERIGAVVELLRAGDAAGGARRFVETIALGQFTRPALLTRGEESPRFFPAVVARLARALPHAAQHLYAGAGHAPHMTHPAAWLEVVGGFIAGVDAVAGNAIGAGAARPAPAG